MAWPGFRPAGWERTVRTICRLGPEPALVVTSIGEGPIQMRKEHVHDLLQINSQ